MHRIKFSASTALSVQAKTFSLGWLGGGEGKGGNLHMHIPAPLLRVNLIVRELNLACGCAYLNNNKKRDA